MAGALGWFRVRLDCISHEGELAILPPLLWIGWTKYEAWRAEQERQRAIRLMFSPPIPLRIKPLRISPQPPAMRPDQLIVPPPVKAPEKPRV